MDETDILYIMNKSVWVDPFNQNTQLLAIFQFLRNFGCKIDDEISCCCCIVCGEVSSPRMSTRWSPSLFLFTWEGVVMVGGGGGGWRWVPGEKGCGRKVWGSCGWHCLAKSPRIWRAFAALITPGRSWGGGGRAPWENLCPWGNATLLEKCLTTKNPQNFVAGALQYTVILNLGSWETVPPRKPAENCSPRESGELLSCDTGQESEHGSYR